MTGAKQLNVRDFGWVLLVLVLFVWTPSHGQNISKFCLEDESAGEALELAVDPIGDIHLSRVLSSSRELVYTQIQPGGLVTNEIVTGPISPFVGSRLRQTDIEMDGLEPVICFRDKLVNRLRLARKVGGTWQLETIQSGITGDGCSLIIDSGQITVAYEASGKLNFATRLAANNWQRQTIDSASGKRLGVTPDMVREQTGKRVVVHRNETDKVLRITEFNGTSWRTVQADHGFFNGGLEPRVTLDSDGSVNVFHGIESSLLGSESDVSLLRTIGLLGGAYSTSQVSGTSIGGSLDVTSGADGLVVATRQLIRSALFGSFDALLLLRGETLTETRLENYGPADGRHVFQFIRLDIDPFGLAVLGYFDSQTGFAAAREAVCLYHPTDSDTDRLPDSIEEILGTDSALADTDGDGRTDGEEVLIDNTDPLTGTQCVPEVERCDGVDQDCDEQIDEQLQRGCYSGPAGSVDQGQCRAGTQSCSLGEWQSCVGEVIPLSEQCSGLDEDCDGVVDESFPTIGQPCDTALNGLCAIGALICANGGIQCEQINFPGEDICSGSDEDCDGAIDEGTLICGTGNCVREVPRCVDGQDNECQPFVGEVDDRTCDGIDDDCDGRLDEDFDVVSTECGIGQCRSTGVQNCQAGEVIDTCQPLAGSPDTSCDGFDQDCDGRIDEAAPVSSITCGEGVCEAIGTTVCEGGVFGEVCTPNEPLGDDVTCDQVDDDCDGRLDEAFSPTTIQCGAGVCQTNGVLTCENGALQETCTPGEPQGIDLCDGLDNDCDGIIDEAFSSVTTECGEGLCQANGQTQCRAGTVVDTCAPLVGAESDTSCDGIDQDCDGKLDEDFVPRASTCGIGLCERQGVVSCIDGRLFDDCLAGTPVGGDTTCDGLDGDCDGVADEGVPGRLEICGVGACRREGRTVCIDAEEVSGCEPGNPALNDSTCDGIDSDCDGNVDEDFLESAVTCGTGACTNRGVQSCFDGTITSFCEPLPAGVDDSCDGLDQDCDGQLDEGYIGQSVTCGVGQCERTIVAGCVGGQVETCLPGLASPSDDSCDNIDNDCDGRVDENVQDVEITCGLGLCRQTGRRLCVDGNWIDNCEPLSPPALDRQCDGLDGDCDGIADEHFVGELTTCGVGACQSAGQVICQGGVPVNSCRPEDSVLADDQCNGVDDDCDTRVDEGFVPQVVSCGIGECIRTGEVVCEDGRQNEVCTPGLPAASDESCDGLDDDCDDLLDEDFAGQSVSCGRGVCARNAITECIEGDVIDRCTPGEPQGDDLNCNGIDDDCDGQIDEGFVPSATSCGVGACSSVGESVCINGNIVDNCDAGSPTGTGDLCDGVDDDCDGRVDEDHVRAAVQCGVGACQNVGTLECQAGIEVEQCTPIDPGPADRQCDGVDTDCDGLTDEDFQSEPTTCGQGECSREGLRQCQEGNIVDTCVAGAPSNLIDLCDGDDSDCDGRVDEDHAITPSICGIGACQSTGRIRCIDGALRDSCIPFQSSRDDTTCNGIDEDCDGNVDEAFLPTQVSCGDGVCRAFGESLCRFGQLSSTCRPSNPIGIDRVCDGIDDDCDGRVDEAFIPQTVQCGRGLCIAFGRERCESGAVLSSCEPSLPQGIDNDCNGVDEDCDGSFDEQAPSGITSCGLGVCQANGFRRCVDGTWENTCVPSRALGADVSCDATDQDCDGRLDEAFPIRTTQCGRGICRAEGAFSCVEGRVTNSCEPNQVAGDDSICNGIDEDCDGSIDEGFLGGIVQCGTGVCESTGTAVCINGTVESSCEPGAPRGSDQNCDGTDDDCDGLVDESNIAQPTICGEGRCLRTGESRCEDGQRVDSCQPGEPQEMDALCNGVDDDCDGLVDEDFRASLTSCGIGACTREAPARCEDGLLVSECIAGEPNENDEICDGVDEDCDGRFDEDFNVVLVTCGVGACERDGELSCNDGVPTEVCRPGIPSSTNDEICDGVDSDCDGIVDEDCPDRLIDSAIASPDGRVGNDEDASDVGSPFDSRVEAADVSTGFYCTDGGDCIDGAFESLCDSRTDCGPSIADPRELYQPVDSGCDCAHVQKVPFTWIGALVCALLGLPRRRFRG